MVAALDGGILLLEGPRLGVEKYWYTLAGVALEEWSGTMP
jgi:hypothetical protein